MSPPRVPQRSIASAAAATVERTHARARLVATHHRVFRRFIPHFVQFVAPWWKGRAGAPTVTSSEADHGADPTDEPSRRSKMNVLKNMEAIFLAAAVLVGVTSAAQAASVAKHARYDAQVTIEGQQMAVVKVTAKRLPAAVKAAI
jgi:hypothetical protein